MSQCDSSKETCETEKPESCCPVEKTVECWSEGFCEAMKEVQIDILKEKIRKAWGPQLEKIGDAVVESMGTEWHAMLTKAKSQMELREKIKSIFMSQK